MSTYPTNSAKTSWHEKQPTNAEQGHFPGLERLEEGQEPSQASDQPARSNEQLYLHRPLPYGMGSQLTRQRSPLGGHITSELGNSNTEAFQAVQSVPSSPKDQLTPKSAGAEPEGRENLDLNEDAEMVTDDPGDDDVSHEGENAKTAAERRAEKRKMKRFR